MILTLTQLQPEDVRYLFCSDARLKRELARSRHQRRHPFKAVMPTCRYVGPEETVLVPRPRPAA
ncbi:MAG: hypothetical protein V2A79_00010 [Planctomycetota bacterium]